MTVAGVRALVIASRPLYCYLLHAGQQSTQRAIDGCELPGVVGLEGAIEGRQVSAEGPQAGRFLKGRFLPHDFGIEVVKAPAGQFLSQGRYVRIVRDGSRRRRVRMAQARFYL